MTVQLLTLSLASTAAVSIGASAVVAGLWPVLRRLMSHLTPAAESRLLLVVAALPLLASVLVLAACFVPALGLGVDHCLHHGPHHPHLCARHLPHVGITLAVAGMASLVLARGGCAIYRVGRGLSRSATTRAALYQAAPPNSHGIRVLPTDRPEAFVVGLLRPQLFASRGLLSMSTYAREVVLTHERAHILRRDPLRALIASGLLAFHLPGIAGTIRRRLQTTAETAADAHAASAVGDNARVADVLVRLVRAHHALPIYSLGFDGAKLEVRVHRLLAPAGRNFLGPAMLSFAALAAVSLTVLFAEPIHHAVGTFLDLLG